MIGMLVFKIIIPLMLVRPVLSQNQISNITASTCASPDGFTSCFDQAEAHTLRCAAGAGSDDTYRLTCACEGAIAEIACALENCWNVVYGCEYQSIANTVASACMGKDIPFFPAPENAPGGCSCNLGDVWYNMSAVEIQAATCVQQSSTDVSQLTACACCDAAGQYTAKFSICPDLDPNLDGYFNDLGSLRNRFSQFGQCGPFFDQYNCVQDLGFPNIGSFPYLSALPESTGTATYSTLPGTISTPLSGETFTFTASWQSMVSTIPITAAGVSNSDFSAQPTAAPTSSNTTPNDASLMNPSGVLVMLYLVNTVLRTYMAL